MRTVKFENVKAFVETDLNLQLEIDGAEFWCPKAQIDPTSDIQEGSDSGILVVNEFWARKNGLIQPAKIQV